MRVLKFASKGRLLLALCCAIALSGAVQFLLLRFPSGWPFESATQFDSPCRRDANRLKEPYTPAYQTRRQKIDPDGPQYAYHVWEGPVLRSDFEQGLDTGHPTLTIKILDSTLYLSRPDESSKTYDSNPAGVKDRREALFAQIHFALYMYDIPDVELTFYIDDEALCGLPLVYYSVRAECRGHSGFTVPSYGAFRSAFGPSQISAYTACLDKSYPLNAERVQKAVWRGATTGARYLSTSTLGQLTRLDLAKLGAENPHLLDVGITRYVQLDEEDIDVLRILREMAPLQGFITMDDFNRYAVVLDLDGNAWSDRFARLMPHNTPILKQKSPWRTYFDGFAQSLSLVTPFERNLSDVLPQVQKALERYTSAEGLEGVWREIQDRRAFAEEHVSQLGVLRATAYVLTVYSHKQEWPVRLEPSDVAVTPEMYQTRRQRFPKQFVRAAQAEAKQRLRKG